jgi:hypothetical protein
VFLLVRDAEQPLDLVDEAARKFLDRVVRTNAVTFPDDMRTRALEQRLLRRERGAAD